MHTPKIVLINVLDRNYYDDCHIPESVCIPLLELHTVAEKWDKTKNIVVYCASNECPLSRQAWHILHKLGFEKIRAFEGGMREWKQQGFPTKGACNLDYLGQVSTHPLPEDHPVVIITAEELAKEL